MEQLCMRYRNYEATSTQLDGFRDTNEEIADELCWKIAQQIRADIEKGLVIDIGDADPLIQEYVNLNYVRKQ